jgi:hypothetical protein
MDIKVYESSRWIPLILAGLCAVIGLILLSGFGHQRSSDIFTPGLVIAAVAYGVVYFAKMASRPPRLRVQTEALVLERPGKTTVLPWNHIDSFVVVRRRGLSLLGYRLRQGADKPPFAWLYRTLEGADAVLYGFWPDNAKTMVAALTLYLNQLRDLNAPRDLNKNIASAPSPTPNRAITPPRSQPVPLVAPQAVSEPRRWFRHKQPPTDASGNKPIVW